MRGATVLLLALLTRALNPCCRSLSLGDAERQNEDRGVQINKVFTFFSHEPMTCKGCCVEDCSIHMVIHFVKKLEVITVQVVILRWPVMLCLCEPLKRQDLDGQHTLAPNQTTLGLHEVSHPSRPGSNYCFVYLLFLKFVDVYDFYPTDLVLMQKKGNISANSWRNAHMKTHTRARNCVCFFNIYIFVDAREQINITDKLWMGNGAWFVSSNCTGENIFKSKDPLLTMFCESVKVSHAAIKALIWTFPCLTDCCTLPSLICMCTTVRCKCVLSHHRSLCMISLMRGNGDSGQFIHIWTCSLQQQKRLNQMAKNGFRAKTLIYKEQKEITPLQWQICTQLLGRQLFHQRIMTVLFITVCLFLISQTAILIYISYNQRFTSIHRVRNSNLSLLLLFTMSWCSLNPLTVTVQSTGCSCKLHHTAFGITFVLCISCVLGKTIVVLMAFKVTIPGSNVMKWFGPLPQRLSVSAFFLTQIVVIVFWVLMHSPLFNMNCNQDQTLECYVLSPIGFCTSLGHLVLSFILAFLICNMLFTTACYSILKIHAVMCLTTRSHNY